MEKYLPVIFRLSSVISLAFCWPEKIFPCQLTKSKPYTDMLKKIAFPSKENKSEWKF